jgi:hypothetical protein
MRTLAILILGALLLSSSAIAGDGIGIGKEANAAWEYTDSAAGLDTSAEAIDFTTRAVAIDGVTIAWSQPIPGLCTVCAENTSTTNGADLLVYFVEQEESASATKLTTPPNATMSMVHRIYSKGDTSRRPHRKCIEGLFDGLIYQSVGPSQAGIIVTVRK